MSEAIKEYFGESLDADFVDEGNPGVYGIGVMGMMFSVVRDGRSEYSVAVHNECDIETVADGLTVEAVVDTIIREIKRKRKKRA